jgi:hypothetical protein
MAYLRMGLFMGDTSHRSYDDNTDYCDDHQNDLECEPGMRSNNNGGKRNNTHSDIFVSGCHGTVPWLMRDFPVAIRVSGCWKPG